MLFTKGILAGFFFLFSSIKVALHTETKSTLKIQANYTRLQYTLTDLVVLVFRNVQQGTRFNEIAQHHSDMAPFYAKYCFK